MNRPSPLLTMFAILLIVLSPVILISKLSREGNDVPLVTDGINTKAKIELKKDSAGKNTEGNIVSFIYVSYRITYGISADTVHSHDSLYMDSAVAMKRMMVAENFKINIPGIKFSEIEVGKKEFDQLKEGDSLKITYSSTDPERAILFQDNKPKPFDKTRSAWITGCIIAFMFGVWIIILNKRRRKQEQLHDQANDFISYSSIKKKDPTSGGAPGR